MVFYPPRLSTPSDLSITLNTDTIECVNQFKYLGLWLDPKLTWNVHCENTLKKMSGRANLIGRHHHSFNKRKLKLYCDSLVLSVLNYLLPVWGSISASKLEDFDVILIRMVKKILIDKSALPTPRLITDQFEKLDWLLVSERRDEAMLKFFFKHFVMNNELNGLLSGMFRFRTTPLTDRLTRRERNLEVPRTKTVFGQSSFSYRVVQCWNSLPPSVQMQKSVPPFCEQLRKHIVACREVGYLLNLV